MSHHHPEVYKLFPSPRVTPYNHPALMTKGAASLPDSNKKVIEGSYGSPPSSLADTTAKLIPDDILISCSCNHNNSFCTGQGLKPPFLPKLSRQHSAVNSNCEKVIMPVSSLDTRCCGYGRPCRLEAVSERPRHLTYSSNSSIWQPGIDNIIYSTADYLPIEHPPPHTSSSASFEFPLSHCLQPANDPCHHHNQSSTAAASYGERKVISFRGSGTSELLGSCVTLSDTDPPARAYEEQCRICAVGNDHSRKASLACGSVSPDVSRINVYVQQPINNSHPSLTSGAKYPTYSTHDVVAPTNIQTDATPQVELIRGRGDIDFRGGCRRFERSACRRRDSPTTSLPLTSPRVRMSHSRRRRSTSRASPRSCPRRIRRGSSSSGSKRRELSGYGYTRRILSAFHQWKHDMGSTLCAYVHNVISWTGLDGDEFHASRSLQSPGEAVHLLGRKFAAAISSAASIDWDNEQQSLTATMSEKHSTSFQRDIDDVSRDYVLKDLIRNDGISVQTKHTAADTKPHLDSELEFAASNGCDTRGISCFARIKESGARCASRHYGAAAAFAQERGGSCEGRFYPQTNDWRLEVMSQYRNIARDFVRTPVCSERTPVCSPIDTTTSAVYSESKRRDIKAAMSSAAANSDDDDDGLQALIQEVADLTLMTYRRDFSPMYRRSDLRPMDWLKITSDAGWGCILRCCQMLLFQSLRRHSQQHLLDFSLLSHSPVNPVIETPSCSSSTNGTDYPDTAPKLSTSLAAANLQSKSYPPSPSTESGEEQEQLSRETGIKHSRISDDGNIRKCYETTPTQRRSIMFCDQSSTPSSMYGRHSNRSHPEIEHSEASFCPLDVTPQSADFRCTSSLFTSVPIEGSDVVQTVPTSFHDKSQRIDSKRLLQRELLQLFLDIPTPPSHSPFSLYSFVRSAGGGIGWASNLYGSMPLESSLVEKLHGDSNNKTNISLPTDIHAPPVLRHSNQRSPFRRYSRFYDVSQDDDDKTWNNQTPRHPSAFCRRFSSPYRPCQMSCSSSDRGRTTTGIHHTEDADKRPSNASGSVVADDDDGAYSVTASNPFAAYEQHDPFDSVCTPLSCSCCGGCRYPTAAAACSRPLSSTADGSSSLMFLGKKAGDWFGPVTAAYAIKYLVESCDLTKASLRVYVNTEGILDMSEIFQSLEGRVCPDKTVDEDDHNEEVHSSTKTYTSQRAEPYKCTLCTSPAAPVVHNGDETQQQLCGGIRRTNNCNELQPARIIGHTQRQNSDQQKEMQQQPNARLVCDYLSKCDDLYNESDYNGECNGNSYPIPFNSNFFISNNSTRLVPSTTVISPSSSNGDDNPSINSNNSLPLNCHVRSQLINHSSGRPVIERTSQRFQASCGNEDDDEFYDDVEAAGAVFQVDPKSHEQSRKIAAAEYVGEDSEQPFSFEVCADLKDDNITMSHSLDDSSQLGDKILNEDDGNWYILGQWASSKHSTPAPPDSSTIRRRELVSLDNRPLTSQMSQPALCPSRRFRHVKRGSSSSVATLDLLRRAPCRSSSLRGADDDDDGLDKKRCLKPSMLWQATKQVHDPKQYISRSGFHRRRRRRRNFVNSKQKPRMFNKTFPSGSITTDNVTFSTSRSHDQVASGSGDSSSGIARRLGLKLSQDLIGKMCHPPAAPGMLLCFPLTLASATSLSPAQQTALARYFEIPWFIGAIGAKSGKKQAHYYVGKQERRLIANDTCPTSVRSVTPPLLLSHESLPNIAPSQVTTTTKKKKAQRRSRFSPRRTTTMMNESCRRHHRLRAMRLLPSALSLQESSLSNHHLNHQPESGGTTSVPAAVELNLLYLDPHIVQSCATDVDVDWDSFHHPKLFRVPMSNIDPAILIAFYCSSAAEVANLARSLNSLAIANPKSPLTVVAATGTACSLKVRSPQCDCMSNVPSLYRKNRRARPTCFQTGSSSLRYSGHPNSSYSATGSEALPNRLEDGSDSWTGAYVNCQRFMSTESSMQSQSADTETLAGLSPSDNLFSWDEKESAAVESCPLFPSASTSSLLPQQLDASSAQEQHHFLTPNTSEQQHDDDCRVIQTKPAEQQLAITPQSCFLDTLSPIFGQPPPILGQSSPSLGLPPGRAKFQPSFGVWHSTPTTTATPTTKDFVAPFKIESTSQWESIIYDSSAAMSKKTANVLPPWPDRNANACLLKGGRDRLTQDLKEVCFVTRDLNEVCFVARDWDSNDTGEPHRLIIDRFSSGPDRIGVSGCQAIVPSSSSSRRRSITHTVRERNTSDGFVELSGCDSPRSEFTLLTTPPRNLAASSNLPTQQLVSKAQLPPVLNHSTVPLGEWRNQTPQLSCEQAGLCHVSPMAAARCRDVVKQGGTTNNIKNIVAAAEGVHFFKSRQNIRNHTALANMVPGQLQSNEFSDDRCNHHNSNSNKPSSKARGEAANAGPKSASKKQSAPSMSQFSSFAFRHLELPPPAQISSQSSKGFHRTNSSWFLRGRKGAIRTLRHNSTKSCGAGGRKRSIDSS